VSGTQLFACVEASALATQPFAVEQMRSSELGAYSGTAKAIDRFAVQAVGGRAFA
jgi:hypothetical protein